IAARNLMSSALTVNDARGFYRATSNPLFITMMRKLLLSAVVLFAFGRLEAGENWPQFRGPGGLGLAGKGATAVEFGPSSTNVLWKIEIPAGNSSPVIWGDKIFLTAFDQKKLEVLCIDRRDGRILWRQPVPAQTFETTHRLGNPATPTAATDGERAYVYFGSFGLLAYDLK